MKFRPATSLISLEEAMKQVEEFNTMKELKKFIKENYLGLFDVNTLKCVSRGEDKRIGWKKTYLITADLKTENDYYPDSAILFSDGDIFKLPEE